MDNNGADFINHLQKTQCSRCFTFAISLNVKQTYEVVTSSILMLQITELR